MFKNFKGSYDPLYFLSSLGNGGLVITFFMYLMFMIKHPNTPLPTFEDISSVILNGNKFTAVLTIVVLSAIIYFAIANIKFLIWNIKEYFKFRKTNMFKVLKTSNSEVSLMAIPLSLAMTVNIIIITAVVFIPNLWLYVEYLFPFAVIIFSFIGIYALKIFSEYVSRIIVNGDFNFDKNNNLGQMISAFSFMMIAAGFSSPAAMSTLKSVSSISTILSIFFTSIALSIILIKLIIGVKSILQKGIDKEGAPSFLIIIPIFTIFGIIIVRLVSGISHTFLHHNPNPLIMFVALGIIASIQIIIAYVGYKVIKKTKYFDEFIYGEKHSSGSYSLICPGVAFMVLGMFFIHWGLVKTGIINQFSLVYYLVLIPYVWIQLKTIFVLNKINKKHFPIV
ncbi:MAG: hypothetical protein JW924_09275 [Fusobacteriaceae bacterium]|nr:hypothetical protein [Fusobacteriaceae bacterium]